MKPKKRRWTILVLWPLCLIGLAMAIVGSKKTNATHRITETQKPTLQEILIQEDYPQLAMYFETKNGDAIE